MLPRIRWLLNVSSLWRICTFVSLFLIFCSGLFASECITNLDEARRYLDADLVIVGDVIGCSTKVVEEKDTPGDSGWVYHWTKFINLHFVRVDSVIKGCFTDSVIIITSYSFRDYALKRIFEGITEKGDSMFSYMGEEALPDDGSWSDIPDSGKFIILLKEKDCIYISTLCDAYSKAAIDFYREVDEKGEDYFKRYEPLMK